MVVDVLVAVVAAVVVVVVVMIILIMIIVTEVAINCCRSGSIKNGIIFH